MGYLMAVVLYYSWLCF